MNVNEERKRLLQAREAVRQTLALQDRLIAVAERELAAMKRIRVDMAAATQNIGYRTEGRPVVKTRERGNADANAS